MIPAGLLNNHIEIFNDGVNLDKSYCITGGRVYNVTAAPPVVAAMIINDMAKHPGKVGKLSQMGYHGYALTEKYCSCVFGPLDGEADDLDGELVHKEYNHCPNRKTCPGRGIVCKALAVENGVLSERQTEVLELTGRCRLNKEIADILGISVETVKIHEKSIRVKSGLDNKMDLVKLAHQKNLIQ